jgi:hypothetical protein
MGEAKSAASTPKARTVELARKMINDRLYQPLDLDPLRNVHRVVDEETKVWLSEAERYFPR